MEFANTDTVIASVSFNLPAYVENLTLVGIADLIGHGNEGANALIGNSGANTLDGQAGNDNLTGNGGDDNLDGGVGDDRLYGGLGNDTLTGGVGYDRMYGGAGNDIYYASDVDDYVYEVAAEGTDLVFASMNHILRVNVENLTLTGTGNFYGKGNDLANLITGNDGANKLYGLAGDDRLVGGLGNDTLDGGAGYDRMYGGVGNDTYIVADSTDYAYEYAGEGIDRVLASITHTLRANVENLTLTGTAAINGTGNDLANILTGNAATNLLRGGAGNDRLYGAAGADVVIGEDGNDWLEGGAGRDRFTGSAGNDVFVFRDGDFSGVTTSSADQIHDFTSGDRIRLDYVDADTATGGDQAFAFLGAGAFSGTAGELRYEQISGNTYVQGDQDGDGLADFWIRVDGIHTLGSNAFIF